MKPALAITIASFLPTLAYAGDILRGGAPAGVRAGNAAVATPNVAVIEAARANAADALARTTRTIQSIQALQASARKLTTRSVPDGLTPGGLKVLPAVATDLSLWKGATLPVPKTAGAQTQVTIKQTQAQAVLNWETFNIGRHTTLTFDQSAGGKAESQWVAINKVTDPSGAPSQILGNLQAGGQVFVLNQNGILFGNTAQVNTHALVASSLPINSNLVARGFLNNPDAQFLFSALDIPALATNATMPAFTAPVPPAGTIGDVTVEAGAQLTAPSSAAKVGGRIALIGANVRNSGTIATPDGQTILAAGLQVGLAPHATNDPSLRGLDVYVGKVQSPVFPKLSAGSAVNAGYIDAPRASVVIAGSTVSQLGAIESSTSVAVNGRIDLQASYNATSPVVLGVARFAPGATGSVTLGAGSATAILPELLSTDTIAAGALPIASQINVQGRTITLGQGAQVLAPNANVILTAGNWLPFNGATRLVASTGQISLDAGAAINVAGTPDVLAPLTQNILTVQLRGAELADSPTQRAGVLRGLTLTIDARLSGTYDGLTWVGTPLGDGSGFLNLIERNVAQLTTRGGNVSLTAGTSVVMRPGSSIDVSGGWTNFEGGFVQTTRVLSNGRVYDISNATPDLTYTGIYAAESTATSARWGVSETFAQPLGLTGRHWENSYLQGANAGQLTITAPAMALDGDLRGQAVSGERQRSTPPTAGALALHFTAEDATSALYLPFSPTPPTVTFGDATAGEVALSPTLLTEAGFSSLTVDNPDGRIVLPRGVSLTTSPGGSVTFAGANLDIFGDIIAPGGAISLTAYNISPATYARLKVQTSPVPLTPAPNPGRGVIILAPGATLSTAGLVLDERATPSLAPLALDGGTIDLTGYRVSLAHGSTIDVSAGVRLDASRHFTYGHAGSITLQAGQDPNVLSTLGGSLDLGAALRGFGAGSLAIQAPSIQIGGTAPGAFSPAFFSTGGFADFTLTGLSSVVVSAGTELDPVAQSTVGLQLNPFVAPVADRPPVSIHLSSPGVVDTFSGARLVRGEVSLEPGAVIRTDPLASVSLQGTTVSVLGSIFAPGGKITIAGSNTSLGVYADETRAYSTVFLGPQAVLSAAGTTLLSDNLFGQRTGTVLPGGSITVSGNIVARAGARLDVSGSADSLDFAPAVLGLAASGTSLAPVGRLVVRQQQESDGGTVTLLGGQSLQSDATLLGAAGGPMALGGSLSISSGRFYAPVGGASPTPLDVTLQVSQSGLTASTVSGLGAALPGFGQFTADRFATGGFDSLALHGTVKFAGPVSIAARGELTVADAGVLYADSAVQLSAAYAKLGTPFLTPVAPDQVLPPFTEGGVAFNFKPTAGTGSVTVSASTIDIGNLSLQGVSHASLLADGGEIRGAGTLDLAGDLTLRAAQIYPPSALTFTIAASGSVSIYGSGARPLPLSAGGQLNIYGASIYQGGTLVAPFGQITLGWDGTGAAPIDPITGAAVVASQNITLAAGSRTSVSAVDPLTGTPLLIPYGVNLNDKSWIDPRGVDITGTGAPTKSITIAGVRVNTEAGSTIDLQAGGDLYAYRWVPGLGGSRDLLASNTSFAVLPGYSAALAPLASYNPQSSNLGTDSGYTNSSLHPGDRIYLTASNGLAAGTYTLLPARYALLPGAVLVTPQAGAPVGSLLLPDGSSFASGYRFNDLNSGRGGDALYSRFEVVPGSVLRTRADYRDYFANSFLAQSAARAAGDAGHLVLEATQAMSLAGSINASANGALRGGLVDIASPGAIVINGGAPVAGALSLNAAQLDQINAASLLIGGVRTAGAVGVTASQITVDNAGAPLHGSEIVLVANGGLTLAEGAAIYQSGVAAPADALVLSGDGVLLRVSGDPAAQTFRTGRTGSATPTLTIGAHVSLSGASLTLDSTAAMSIDPHAALRGQAISLRAGRIALELDNSAAAPASGSLVLGGELLQSAAASQRLSLLSYSSIDLLGTGTLRASGALELHTGALRGAGGSVTIAANSLLLDNAAASVASPAGASAGTLDLRAGQVRIGAGQLTIDQFQTVDLQATQGLVLQGHGGLNATGDLNVTAPFVTAAKAASQSLTAGGALTLEAPASGTRVAGNAGLGASLTLQGSSVAEGTRIDLPSGALTLHATTGDVTISGTLDAAGTAQKFFDLTRYTGAGSVTLQADAGSVNVGSTGVIDVSAAGPGNGGAVSVSTPGGSFSLAGKLLGQGGASFALDAGSLASLDTLAPVLTAGGFSRAQSFRVRTGDVALAGVSTAHAFDLSADLGSITVTGTIDASGDRGGSISLAAGGALTVAAGARLTVAATDFDAAGKGGSVSLSTRGLGGAELDVQSGSSVDLSVASSAGAGQLSGTLHLRAPQNSAGTDLLIGSLAGTVSGASLVTVEGYHVFDLTGPGQITSAVQDAVMANSTLFANGATAARLLAGNPSLTPVLVVTPGAEIVNRTGDLTLGSPTSTSASDWNLATYRFGPQLAPGVLTLRAVGNLVFYNTLSDGFTTSAYNSALLAQSPLLPANAQSWSYQLTAGADLTAAETSRVVPLSSGSLLLGKNAGTASSTSPGLNAQTSAVIGNRFQVIRTGSGDITISAGGDVQLLNTFATIYTAGTQVADPTLGGTFDVPQLIADPSAGSGVLGAPQQNPAYPAQFALAGGNVKITAGADIAHYTRNSAGQLIADSSRELPMNWLDRRGYVDPGTGQFGIAGGPGRGAEAASTAWWVDYSNFFESVGALGGGNVTLTAGRDISNVDAVIPTNARLPKGAPSASRLVQLGGGDLVVSAGRNLDAGVYYVERGQGSLSAGGSIVTNATRSPSLTNLTNSPALAPETWLPTTLFVGQSSFDVSAGGDALLGPAANPFLLPAGYNNTVWYKTYFSTYTAASAVSVSSLAGNVTLRESASTAGNAAQPLLQTWLQSVLAVKSTSASWYQPWLRLDETSTGPFATVAALVPGTLRATAFSGDLSLIGSLTLSPSPTGTVELAAAGSLNGVNRNGQALIAGSTLTTWGSSTINLSDANPSAIPGVDSPFAYQTVVGTVPGLALTTRANFLAPVDVLFRESGATRGPAVTLSSKQALHAPGPLHRTDPDPVRLLARRGSISGFQLFSGKAAEVLAGRDITDLAVYVQDVHPGDVTLVAAGRDLIAWDANSPLRVAAGAAGNILNVGDFALSGDVQLGGPGLLEVLAGRNLDLGIGPVNTDGTGVGIATVGNARNPALPFDGASIIVAAGLGTQPSAFTPSTLGTLFTTLRDTGRQFPTTGNYQAGQDAIARLFGQIPAYATGDISLTSRAIKTESGGSISILAPSGKLTVGFDIPGAQATDQGILTEDGGDISIFAKGNVDVGTSRIFTLRGGNIVIWSSTGNIAAGAAAKTVASAPPTRVIIDPQSGDVDTDLAGLATGGGIGVLATVAGVPPGDVDLVAPKGTIDAGDAGIRSQGNLNLAATAVLNADNIQVTGTSSGTPAAPTVAAPNLGALTAASSATGATTQAARNIAPSSADQKPAEEAPSIVTVEVIGYGGGE